MTGGEDLSARKRAFVAAMAAGLTQTEAAASVGVKDRTARRYMASPLVRAELASAQDGILSQVTLRMGAGSNRALDVLEAVMVDKTMPASVRVRAALGWLEHRWKAQELHVLTQRIEALEEAQTKGG